MGLPGENYMNDEQKQKMTDAAIRCLNNAYKRDPNAIHALVANRVPCNKGLADDPVVQVSSTPVENGGYNVGMLGVINGILASMGLPLLAGQWDTPPGREGPVFVGFCRYTPATMSGINAKLPDQPKGEPCSS